jgi:hypothetical protein
MNWNAYYDLNQRSISYALHLWKILPSSHGLLFLIVLAFVKCTYFVRKVNYIIQKNLTVGLLFETHRITVVHALVPTCCQNADMQLSLLPTFAVEYHFLSATFSFCSRMQMLRNCHVVARWGATVPMTAERIKSDLSSVTSGFVGHAGTF